MLTKFPPSLDHPNITELTYWRSIYEERLNFFEIRKHPLIFLARFRSELSSMARDLYNDTTVMELYHSRRDFDVVFVDALFNEVMFLYNVFFSVWLPPLFLFYLLGLFGISVCLFIYLLGYVYVCSFLFC